MKYIITLLSLTLFFSCQNLDKTYSNKEILFHGADSFKNVKERNAEKLFSISDSLISPTEIEIVGNHIILLDRKSDRPFHLIDISKEKYVGSYAKRGQGPGELQVPWKISKKNDNEFIAYDVAGKKILGYTIGALTNRKPPFLEKKINEEGICSAVEVIDNNIYYTNDLVTTNRIYKLDTLQNQIKGYGSLLYNSKNVSDFNFGQACRSIMAYNNNKFVIGYLLAPHFEIYDPQKNEWKSILALDNFPPIFEEIVLGENKRFSTTEETKLGFVDISLTDKYIYLLYSGEKMSDHKNDEGNIILVFDYDGNPITQYKLDNYITIFEVLDDRIVYAIQKDIRSELIKYNLK